MQADRQAVDQELRQARAGYLPQVDLRAAAGPEYTYNSRFRTDDNDDDETLLRQEAQLTLSQMLYDGRATESEVSRQKARVSSAAYRVAEASEFVGLDAVEAHLNVLRNQAIVELNEDNVQQHERYLNQVGDLERAGRGDISQVRQTEARLGAARDALAVSRGDLNDAVARYRRIVGISPVDLEDPAEPVAALPASADTAAELASVSSPTVAIAAADVDVAKAELQATRAAFLPNFALEMGAGAGDNLDGVEEDVYDAAALLVMRYNLFRGGADVALEREAFHRLNEARAALAAVRLDAEEEARVSYNALQTAEARVESLQQQAEAQRRTRDAYASQFDIGQRDLLDLLDAENEYFLDRANLLTAEYTQVFAAYRVLAVVGDLLDTLDVAKPSEHIDIYRSPEDVITPERVEERSQQLVSPKSTPRYLRSEEAGEPPLLDRDMLPYAGREGETAERGDFFTPPEPESEERPTLFEYFRGDAAIEPQPAPVGEPSDAAGLDGEAVPDPQAAVREQMRSYEGFSAFFANVMGVEEGEVAVVPTVARADVAALPDAPRPAPALEAAVADAPAPLEAQADDPRPTPSGLFAQLLNN